MEKKYFIVDENKLSTLKEALQVYPTNAELILNELQDYYDAIWNEFMTLVGVGNNTSPKRERLIAGEVDAVNEQSQAFANARLKSRQRACDLINSLFDLDVQVRYRFNKDVIENEEVEENGALYDKPNERAGKSSPSKEE